MLLLGAVEHLIFLAGSEVLAVTMQLKLVITCMCTRQLYKPVKYWPLPNSVMLDFLLS